MTLSGSFPTFVGKVVGRAKEPRVSAANTVASLCPAEQTSLDESINTDKVILYHDSTEGQLPDNQPGSATALMDVPFPTKYEYSTILRLISNFESIRSGMTDVRSILEAMGLPIPDLS